MKTRNVGILIFHDVEVLDFAGPYEVFSRTRLDPGAASRRSDDSAPFNVFTVAEESHEVRATGGLRVIPDYKFGSHPDIHLLVVPGGFGTRPLLAHAATLEWIETVAASAELITSVCTGSLLLAAAGLLEGRRATTHWAALDELEAQEGVTVERHQRVVHDGIITSADDGIITSADDGDITSAGDVVITSAGVASGIDMSFEVVEALHGAEVANETARYIEYRRVRSEP